MSRLLQFLIALVGLGITVMLGLASMKNEQVQTKQALLGLFSNSVSVARNNCDAGLLFIAEDAVRELAKIDAAAAKLYGERLEEVDASIRGPACTAATSAAAAQVVASAPEVLSAAPMPPAADAEARDRAVVQAPAARAVQAEVQEQARQVAITSQMASRSQNLEFRKLQSKIAPDLNGSGKYYAVLASYGVGDGSTYDAQLGAAAHYNQLVSAASKTKAVVEVYRTGTGHFAIVLRPDPPTRDGARELTLLARREGWATDSFVQVARDWVQCKEPGSIDGLRACAK